MRFGITSRLFATILITNVVIAVAFGAAMQFSVKRGFHEYVKDRELRRLQQLAGVFGAAYAQHSDWSFVRDDEMWRRLRGSDRPARRRNNVDDKTAVLERPPLQPNQNGAEVESRPSASPDTLPFGSVAAARPVPGYPLPRDLPDRADPDRFGGGAPLTLLDATQRFVRGNALGPSGPALSVPVLFEGAIVGYVAVPQLPFAASDDNFLRQQLKTSWIIVCIALLLAAAVSVVLARGFLAPIRRLARGTHRLATGDYAQRIANDRTDELGQLIDDFNGLAATLDRAESARREFLADVSHELRTPLAILRGELEALEDGVRSLTPEAIKSLQVEVAALAGLIDDLRDLSDADVGNVSYERNDVDLSELLRATLYAFRDRFVERRLSVDTTAISTRRVAVVGDTRRLTQLFNNLFENTLAYTDTGGQVRLSLAPNDGFAVLELEDSAPGVPAHLLPRLFERLFRVEHSRSRAHGGAGLGLALCRSIVEMHHGVIEASASKLGGLRMLIRLPLAGTKT